MRESTNLGLALSKLVLWQERLHDWTEWTTYTDLIALSNGVSDAAARTQLAALGRCLNCQRHEYHGEKECGGETGNYIYDMWCRCSTSLVAEKQD